MISFMMREKYTLDTLPRPDDSRIHIKEIGEHSSIAVRFSGHSHEKRVQEKIGELTDWLSKNGLSPRSNFRLARFDPPWVPGFMRHNEIMVDVE